MRIILAAFLRRFVLRAIAEVSCFFLLIVMAGWMDEWKY